MGSPASRWCCFVLSRLPRPPPIDVAVSDTGGPLLKNKISFLRAISTHHNAENTSAFAGSPSLLLNERAPIELRRRIMSRATLPKQSNISELDERQDLNPDTLPFFVPTGNRRIPGNVKIVTPTIELKNLLIDLLLELFQLAVAALGERWTTRI